jgi:hypothetical protein
MVVVSVDLEACEGLVNWRILAHIVDEPAKRRPERVEKDDGDDEEAESDEEPEEGKGGGAGGGIYQRIIAKWSSMNRQSTGGGEDGGGSESEGYTSNDYDLEDGDLIDNTELQVCPPSTTPLPNCRSPAHFPRRSSLLHFAFACDRWLYFCVGANGGAAHIARFRRRMSALILLPPFPHLTTNAPPPPLWQDQFEKKVISKRARKQQANPFPPLPPYRPAMRSLGSSRLCARHAFHIPP